MDDALGNALMVEMEDLLAQHEIFQQRIRRRRSLVGFPANASLALSALRRCLGFGHFENPMTDQHSVRW
jgi:hypothetical protein